MSTPMERDQVRGGLMVRALVAVAIQCSIAIAAVLIKLPTGPDDPDIYLRYATMALEGKVPYRDFRVEYPPLAMPLFLAPALISRGLIGFRVAFGIEMLLLNAATVWLVAAWVARRRGLDGVRARLAWYTVFFAMLSRLMVTRYDAAPMLLGFAAAFWWFSGRAGAGGVAAAVGALMKVYPIAVAAVAAAWDLTRPGAERGRGTAAFLLTAAAGAVAWLAVGGVHGAVESLGYQLERGFEYGGIYSGAQMLAATLLGEEIVIARDHAAWASVTPWSARLYPLVFPVQAAAILGVCWAFVRRGMTEGPRYAGAAVLAFVVTGKVFSPQYLIWLVPFIAVLEGRIARRGCWLFAAGCATALLAPGATNLFPRTSLWVILAYNIKNALFLGLLALLVFGPRAEPREPGTMNRWS